MSELVKEELDNMLKKARERADCHYPGVYDCKCGFVHNYFYGCKIHNEMFKKAAL